MGALDDNELRAVSRLRELVRAGQRAALQTQSQHTRRSLAARARGADTFLYGVERRLASGRPSWADLAQLEADTSRLERRMSFLRHTGGCVWSDREYEQARGAAADVRRTVERRLAAARQLPDAVLRQRCRVEMLSGEVPDSAAWRSLYSAAMSARTWARVSRAVRADATVRQRRVGLEHVPAEAVRQARGWWAHAAAAADHSPAAVVIGGRHGQIRRSVGDRGRRSRYAQTLMSYPANFASPQTLLLVPADVASWLLRFSHWAQVAPTGLRSALDGPTALDLLATIRQLQPRFDGDQPFEFEDVVAAAAATVR